MSHSGGSFGYRCIAVTATHAVCVFVLECFTISEERRGEVSTARPPATKSPFLLKTNQNTTSPAAHHQNQPPDFGSVHESQQQQLRLSLHCSHRHKGGSYGNKILYKNLDLTQDFSNKISFHFLWVKMLPKNLPKIFRWPEMCPLDKILAQDFQMAAFMKILGRRDTSVVPLLPTENCKTLF